MSSVSRHTFSKLFQLCTAHGDIHGEPLVHGDIHGKFGAIERLNLLRALTPLLCQSHKDKCF